MILKIIKNFFISYPNSFATIIGFSVDFYYISYLDDSVH